MLQTDKVKSKRETKRILCLVLTLMWGWDSVVGIGTCYGDRIPLGVEIFHTRPDQPWGPPSPLYNGYWDFFPGVKAAGAWR